MLPKLNVSIVLYHSEQERISELIGQLSDCPHIYNIILIDNSSVESGFYSGGKVIYQYIGKNIGFGPGHNIAFKKSIEQGIPFHLIMNPDVSLNNQVFEKILNYIQQNKDVGMLMPRVLNLDGSDQLVPKMLPTPFDPLIKVVPLLRWIFKRRFSTYVLADYMDNIINIPFISGCFTLFRTTALKETGLFDEGFFLYFEDFDLSRRMHMQYKTVYFPIVSIIHEHERGATKDIRLLFVFVSSLIRYFNKYGWFNDKQRKIVNKKILGRLD